MERRLGGWSDLYESSGKLTDVWYLPTANGNNDHGAEFPISLPGRCIQLTTKEGDLVLDPFIGSGTTALAAMELKRRCIGFDTSRLYLETAEGRIQELAAKLRDKTRPLGSLSQPTSRTNGHGNKNGIAVLAAAIPAISENGITRRRTGSRTRQ